MSLGIEPEEPAESRPIRQAGSPPLQGGTILIVDDTPANLKLLADTLTAEGYEVLPADSGELALAAVAVRPPELILLDIQMPGMDGFEVLRRLRARADSCDIPVVLISASTETAERVEGLRMGAVDFINKPFQREELLARVQIHLKFRHMRVRLEQQADDMGRANAQLQSELAERKQAEEALRESEDRYRGLFESSRDAVMTLEPPSWRFTSGNLATVKMFGAKNEEEFTSRGPWELSPDRQPDGRVSVKKAKEMIETAMREGSHFFEWTHQRINGEEFPATVLLSRMETAGKVFLQATVRDITEHKRAEEALRRSDERYRAVADFANDAIITADGAGNIMGWNRGAECTFGYTEAEVLGQPLTRLMPHGYRDPHAAGLSRVTTGGAPHVIGKTVELEGLRKDGSAFPLEISLAGWQTDAGHFYTGILRDITARKQAEAALARVSRENERLLSSVGEGVFGLDLEGRTSFANPAAARLLGYSVEEMIGRPQHALIHHTRTDGAPYPREDCPIYAAFKDGQVHHIDTEVFWRKDGTSFPVDYTSTPIRDERGALQGAVVVFRDITERKRVEAEVRAARDYLAKLINTIGDPVLVKDAQHRLVLVNDAECALTGRTREELIGKTDYDFFPKEQVEIFWKMDDRVLETGEENVNEETLTDARTGKPREVITRKTRYVDPSGNRFVVAVIRDITERKRAEEAMRENERLLRLIIDLVPHHIFAKDRDGRFLLINRAAAASCGRRPDEMIGRSEQELRPDKAHTEKFLRDDQEVIDQVASKFIPEEPITYPDNQVHFLQTTKIPFMPPGSKQRAVLGVAVDITERKRAETALRDSEALYHSLVTQLPQCILRKDRDGRFTFANQHFCRLLGKAPAEIQGRTDFDFFPRELAEKYRQDDLRVMQERLVWEQVEQNALPNGERIFVQVVKTPLVNAAGDVVGVQGIFWDITERRRTEAERERLVAELQRALDRVKTLSGLVPICSGCKKIRDDKNYWHHVESYVSAHTDATFTHGMCPDCAKKYFPGLEDEEPDNSAKE